MSDDTRDIAIQTRADLKNLSDQVSKLTGLVESMDHSLTERKGAEKVARWIVGIGGGAAGAALTKFGAVLFNAPFPR